VRRTEGKNDGHAGLDKDEILFHELVHALRQMEGQMMNIPLSGTHSGYDNLEEFHAVVLTNIYTTDPTCSRKGPAASRQSPEFQALAPRDQWKFSWLHARPGEPALCRRVSRAASVFSRAVGHGAGHIQSISDLHIKVAAAVDGSSAGQAAAKLH